MLDIAPGTSVQTIYLTIPGGVPGHDFEVPGDLEPWQFSASMGSSGLVDCTYEGYAGRIYCPFELSPAELGTVQELFAYVNDCPYHFYHNPQVSILEPVPVCTSSLGPSECSSAGGEYVEGKDLPDTCECPSP